MAVESRVLTAASFLGPTFRSFRRRFELTQEQLGELLDVDVEEIRAWEAGKFPALTMTKAGGWTSGEVAELRRLAPLGAEMAAYGLGRSRASVKAQANRLRISLRRAGQRGGLILGQPRDLSASKDRMLAKLREDVLAGRVDPARAERRGKLIKSGRLECPNCGVRPIEVASTGFCIPCHREALGLGHDAEAQAIELSKDLDAARARKHRRRVKASRGDDEAVKA